MRSYLKDYRNTEEQLSIVTQKYNNLEDENAMKNNELENLQKQVQTLAKTGKGEFVISGQSSIASSNPYKISDDKYIRDLKQQLGKKEMELQQLKRQNDCLSAEIGCLKQYVHKLILNNNNIKAAVSTLVAEIMNKLNILVTKNCNSDYRSAEEIAADILRSLTKIEYSVANPEKPPQCPISKCSCMIEIRSNYSVSPEESNNLANENISESSLEIAAEDLAPKASYSVRKSTLKSTMSNMEDCEGCNSGSCTDCPSVTHCLDDDS